MGNETGIYVFFLLIAIVALLWKIKKNHIEYSKYKKSETKEGKATILSFDGAVRTSKYSFNYRYSYEYNVDNNSYIRKDCRLPGIYSKGDRLKILYRVANPEDSVTEEEYTNITLMRNIGYLILLGVNLAIFIFLVYVSL